MAKTFRCSSNLMASHLPVQAATAWLGECLNDLVKWAGSSYISLPQNWKFYLGKANGPCLLGWVLNALAAAKDWLKE